MQIFHIKNHCIIYNHKNVLPKCPPKCPPVLPKCPPKCPTKLIWEDVLPNLGGQ